MRQVHKKYDLNLFGLFGIKHTEEKQDAFKDTGKILTHSGVRCTVFHGRPSRFSEQTDTLSTKVTFR